MGGGVLLIALLLITTVSSILGFRSCNKTIDSNSPYNEQHEEVTITINKIDLTLNRYTINPIQTKFIAQRFMNLNKYLEEKEQKSNIANSNYTEYNINQTNDFDFIGKNLTVDQIKTIYDSANRPIIHILNFIPKGFCVMSATMKEKPILSFSSENHFNIEEIKAGEVFYWSSCFQRIINLLNDTNYVIPEEVLNDWMYYGLTDTLITYNKKLNNNSNTAQIVNSTASTSNCQYVDYIVWGTELLNTQIDTLLNTGVLLATTWDQNKNYNNFCPDKGCTGLSPGNSKAWAGCVPVAVGQIIKYWYNNSQVTMNIASFGIGPVMNRTYFTNIMADNISSFNNSLSSNNEVNRFLADLGYAIGVSYGCDGTSGSSTEANAVLGRSGLNTAYYWANFDDNHSALINSLLNRRPVYLDGCKEVTWYGFAYSCHAWVADGYRKIQTTNNYRSFPYIMRVLECEGGALYSTKNKTIINISKTNKETVVGGPGIILPEPIYYSYSTVTEYVHHNWGWGGYSNNWYLNQSLSNPNNNTNFLYYRGMITCNK